MSNIAEIEVPSTPLQQKTEKPKKEKKPKPPSPRQIAVKEHADAFSGDNASVVSFDRDGRLDSANHAVLMYLRERGYTSRLRLDKTTKRIFCDNEEIDTDEFCAAICAELPTMYAIKGSITKSYVYDIVYGVAFRRPFHPTQELVASLPAWDGISRLGAFFIRHFACEDSPYVRHVARIFFSQLITRMARPGCKADFMPVLYGPQGIGKSTLGEKLFTSLRKPELAMSAGDNFGDKLVMEMLGKALIEIPEMASITRRESSEVKSFLTKDKDIIRVPYAVRASAFPRTQVFYGTTNEKEFIKDKENRRFLPLSCGAKNEIKEPIWTVSDEYIQQVFAEAKDLCDSGFQYWLEPENLAEISQEYMNTDEIFMDTLILAIERAKNLALTAKPPRQYITTPEVMSFTGFDKNIFQQARVREQLRELGFRRNTKKVGGKAMKVWEFE